MIGVLVHGSAQAAIPRRAPNEAPALAERLTKGPPFGLEISKESLDREWTMDLDTALAWETQVQAGCMLDPNFAESHAAFRAKRAPRFG